MTSEYGEIRYDDPEMPQDCRAIARMLDTHGRCSFRYAAFGTLHTMIAIDARALLIATGTDREPEEVEAPLHRELWIGGQFGAPPGLGYPQDNGHTLWIRGGDNKGTSVWMNRCGYHDPAYLAEKFTDNGNLTDGTGLAVLLLLVEVYRGLVYDIIPTVETWVDRMPSGGPERDLPAFARQFDEGKIPNPDGDNKEKNDGR